MTELTCKIELAASFLERLDAIEAFLTEADAAFAFDDLLAELRSTVVPNLRRFPRIGRKYLDRPQSMEGYSSATVVCLPALHAGRLDALWADLPPRPPQLRI